MTMASCTCGCEGKHWHTLDGKDVCLCGRCNAVLMMIKVNHVGLPVDFAITTDRPDDEGKTYVDRAADAKPSDSRTKATIGRPPQVPSSAVILEARSDDLRSIFVPIDPEANEVVRTPPTVE